METLATYHNRLTLLPAALKTKTNKQKTVKQKVESARKKCLHVPLIRAAVFVAIAESVESDNGLEGTAA